SRRTSPLHNTPTPQTDSPSLHDALPILTEAVVGMSIHGIHDHRNAALMRLVHQSLKILALPEPLVHPEIPDRAAQGFSETGGRRSEEHTSELQSLTNLVCRLLLDKKNSS